MATSLVRSFGNSETKSRREDEGFGLWREVDRVFDNLARSFGRSDSRHEMVRGGFAGEVLAPNEPIGHVPLNSATPARPDPLPDIPLHPSTQAKAEVLSPPTAQPTPIRVNRAASAPSGALNPIADASEDDDTFEVIVELPGVKEADIDIEFSDGAVTISAERRRIGEGEDKKHHVRERSFGTFKRRFVLPFQANPDIINASYEDGIVTISVPRPPETKPRTKKIDLKHH